jgi:hypothetical protein
MIIAHEQAHVRHHHSFDLILAQLFCAVQWFNPAAWMLRRSLMEVHEYEADAQVLEDGFDGRRYQICLVRAALQGSFATTTNNFSNCSTKKRIVMMNRHSTNPWARLKVLLMLPAVALSVIVASSCKQDTNTEMEVNSKDALPTSVYWDIEECEECGIEEADTSQVFMVVEEMPEFPGGEEALMEYLRSNIQYPERCKENKIQGRVLITFVVNKDGSIVESGVVKSAGPEGVELDVMTVMFESDNSFRLYYTFSDINTRNSYNYSVDGSTVTLKQRSSDGAYYIEKRGVPARLLHKPHTYAVSKDGKTYTLEASMMTYAYVAMDYGSASMKTLAKAFYLYNQAAKAYFGDAT